MQLAQIDPLTGAFTRAYLLPDFTGDCTFVDLIGLGKANARSFSAGDAFVQRAAEKLKPYGPLIRIGGDEFLILGQRLSKSRLYKECGLKAFVAADYKESQESWSNFIDRLWVRILAAKSTKSLSVR